MAESNATQVILTDDGIKIIKAQNTADNAASQASKADSAALIAQEKANAAKAAADSTYNYANSEMAVQSTATAKAQKAGDDAFSKAQAVGIQASAEILVQSTATAKAQSKADDAFSKAQAVGSQASAEIAVQSNATVKAQNTADNAFSKAQAVGIQASAEILVQSTATAKAQSKADDAFSKAQAVGSQASAEIAVQSTATAKAQSKADDAFSKATTAIDNGQVTSQAVTDLKDGSKLTIAELENGLATKVANSDYASYKEQTASQIGQMVTNGAFSAYQQTTADLISSKVATKDFSAYQATTAKSIESKVESNDFNTYKTQTADLIAEKVANKDFSAYQATTAKSIESKVESNDFNTYKSQTADLIAEKVANKDFSTYKTQTANLISEKVATKDFSAYQDTTAKAISSKVESKDFNTYKTQTDSAILSKVSSVDFNNLTISNRNLALGTATPFKMNGNNTENQLQNSYTFSKVIPRGTVVTVTFDVSSSTGVGDFTMQFFGGDPASSWQVISKGNLVNGTKHVSATITTDSDHLSVWPRLDYATGDVTFSNFIISESSKEVSWTPAPEDQATQSQITQLSGEIEQKVNSGEFSTYKSQTADLIAEKVANKDFSTYKEQTANLIASKVATKDFSAYQATTAKSIESKVESQDFNTYKEQTDKAILSKVANSEFSTYKTQTAGLIESKVDNGTFSSYKTETANLIASKVANKDFSTYQKQTADLISEKVANKDFSAYQATTAKLIESKVESNDFNTYKSQTDKEILSKVKSSDFQALQTQVDNSAVGTNLIVQSTLAPGYLDRDKGSVNGYGNSDFHIGYIPVSGITTVTISSPDYTFTYNANHTLAMYDADKKFLGWELLYPTTTFSQENVAFIMISINFVTQGGTSGSMSDWLAKHRYKLEKGSVATDYSVNPEDQATQSQITQLSGEIEQKVNSGDFSTYKTQTANLIAEKVANKDFSTYKEQTANLISEKVTTKDFSAYQDTTAKAISSKVESKDFNTYKSQTANTIASKVNNGDFSTYKTQTANDINLRVTKGDLIDEINLKAGNTLISSSGQLTLSGKTIYFDTVNPVIIPSANISGTLTGKELKAGTINGSKINGSTINGGTLNMQADGLINSPYTGIEQTADQFYHPWKLNTGQLTIGQGYITSVSSGTRSINGVPKQFNQLQGTLSASYLKFTNNYGARTYIDADMLTCTSPTNNGTMVAINATGNIDINAGTPNAPALTISKGYIDASSSSSYGKFGAITLGYNAHTINSDSSLFFESGHGSGNPGINIWAKGFQSLSSRLSTKRQVRLLDDEHSNSLLLGADTATFQYNQDTNADNSNEGVIIDDVNTTKQYSLPDELMTRDGKAPTDLMSFIARVISQNKYQARLIEDLQIRLRKVEIKNEQ
ncbi:cell envelope integrity protein TolA [Lactiplantibacillus plantarum]|uniref:cell envelope integrity protein TolA n=1 Tax=Lactiplantibacillus plantarum TaxID=1590 RepID=UPI0020A279CA|nr:cell envelope integrity protein TolA [Lactiplantibacillus plantarum]UTD42263.1 cell envelope integrity protein TolA [Lactiplantibacillus plantarum]